MNTPEQNIIATLKGKKVLFLENSSELDDQLIKEFVKILESANIEYRALCDLSEVAKRDLDEIIEAVFEADAIVFMTQWVYTISFMMRELIENLKDKKIIVEIYISEPTWYYARQHGTHHDVYIYTCNKMWEGDPKEEEKFYKLTDKPYWDYKNKFDL